MGDKWGPLHGQRLHTDAHGCLDCRAARAFLGQLAQHGGRVVSSAACTEGEVAVARAEGRFYATEGGLGYVRLPPGGCTVSPAGWRCTREAGHPGSCAAVKDVT